MANSTQYVTFDLPILNGKIDTTRILHMNGVDYKTKPIDDVMERAMNSETARLLYRFVDDFQAEGVRDFITLKSAEAYIQGSIVDISTVSSDNPLFIVIPFYHDNDSFTQAVASSFDDFEHAVSCALKYAQASKDRLKYGVFELTSIYVLSRSVKWRN